MGAYDEAHWQTQVREIKAGTACSSVAPFSRPALRRDIGKLVKLTAGTEAQAYGVLLDPAIDTAARIQRWHA